ncbi:hypothetical protein INT47_006662 [Mucor saturninus]|uniref:Uncharacterized protein n=1 Tax=Mucor saturninus TaxID=64648 RepID=A0A8H7QS79_9FUNG|nr:hypothetical protein INT47_006662 [Mucor saturninus]
MSHTIDKTTSADDLLKIYNIRLDGKVAIVTGSNTGIGLATARSLASVGAKVIIPCRTLEKAQGAVKVIKETVPEADLIAMQLDLSDLASVRKFAQDFLQLDLPLHILINNAGIMGTPKSFTKDGFESQFGVNHLAHFLLVDLLTEKLKASAPARIVITSSSANSQFVPVSGLDFDNLNSEKEYASFPAYGRSKFANVLHAKELQRRFDAENVDITVTSLHPGYCKSELGRYMSFSSLFNMLRHMKSFKIGLEIMSYLKTAEIGASTNVFCAVSPDVIKGEFYSDNAVNTYLLHEEANNEAMAKKLFEVSRELVNKTL